MKKFLILIIIILLFGLGIWIFYPNVFDFLKINEPETGRSVPVQQEPENTESEPELIVEENLTLEEYMTAGQRYFAQGYLTLASNNFSQAVNTDSSHKEAHLQLIKTFIALRDFDSAEASCVQALEVFQKDQDLTLLLGEVYIQQSRFEDAKTTFNSLADTVAEKKYYLGALFAFEGNHEEAKVLLKEAQSSKMQLQADVLLGAYSEFDLFPDGSQLHLKLLIAKAFDQLGLYEMAVKNTKEILKEKANYRDAWLLLGHSYLALEKYDFAKSAFLQGLELDPTKPETAYFLALTEAELKNNSSALEYMNKALLNGYEPKKDVLVKLGEYNLNDQKYSDAVKYYEEALGENPQSVNDFIRPIWISIDYLNDPDEALRLADMALEKYSELAMAHNLQGWAYLAGDDFDNAEIALNKALEIDKKMAGAYLNLGKLYEKKGEKSEALKNYKIAYEIDPSSSIGETAVFLYNDLVARELN